MFEFSLPASNKCDKLYDEQPSMSGDPYFYSKRRGVGILDTYEALSLILTFGLLLIALISYLDRSN